ncbi:hypothetical protein HZH66_002793 [Vespula vulgaris]|uniref:Uncharacterized protein n=1 Tax=Vespula vulgaris TaxID=7454 RepID=A0A834KQD8_VESVU|nr:hypothetical protein HZH66_002793 [Vespula vulgaris]
MVNPGISHTVLRPVLKVRDYKWCIPTTTIILIVYPKGKNSIRSQHATGTWLPVVRDETKSGYRRCNRYVKIARNDQLRLKVCDMKLRIVTHNVLLKKAKQKRFQSSDDKYDRVQTRHRKAG